MTHTCTYISRAMCDCVNCDTEKAGHMLRKIRRYYFHAIAQYTIHDMKITSKYL